MIEEEERENSKKPSWEWEMNNPRSPESGDEYMNPHDDRSEDGVRFSDHTRMVDHQIESEQENWELDKKEEEQERMPKMLKREMTAEEMIPEQERMRKCIRYVRRLMTKMHSEDGRKMIMRIDDAATWVDVAECIVRAGKMMDMLKKRGKWNPDEWDYGKADYRKMPWFRCQACGEKCWHCLYRMCRMFCHQGVEPKNMCTCAGSRVWRMTELTNAIGTMSKEEEVRTLAMTSDSLNEAYGEEAKAIAVKKRDEFWNDYAEYRMDEVLDKLELERYYAREVTWYTTVNDLIVDHNYDRRTAQAAANRMINDQNFQKNLDDRTYGPYRDETDPTKYSVDALMAKEAGRHRVSTNE